jgi:hypothetical protein
MMARLKTNCQRFDDPPIPGLIVHVAQALRQGSRRCRRGEGRRGVARLPVAASMGERPEPMPEQR